MMPTAVSKSSPVASLSRPVSPDSDQDGVLLFPALSSPVGRVSPIARRRLNRFSSVERERRPYKFQPIRDCDDPVFAGAERVGRIYRNLSKHEPPKDTTSSVVLQDLVIDTSAGWRAFGDLYPGQAPLISDPIAQGVGMTTAMCAVEGAFMLADTLERYKFAKSIGSQKQTVLEGVNLVRDGLLMTVGTAYAAYRPLRIATFYQGVDVSPAAATTLGQATYGTLAVGNALLGALYATQLGTTSYKLYNSISLRKGLTPEILAEKLEDPKIDEVDATDDELEEMVKTRAAAWIDGMLDKMNARNMLDDRPNLTEDQRKDAAWNMLNANLKDVEHELRTQWPDLAPELMRMHGDNPILAMGHALKIDAEKIQRTMDLNNCLGADFVKELKAKDAITQADVDQAKEVLNKNIGWQVLGILLAIGGLVWVIFSYISDPISNWAYAIQSVVCALVDAKGVKDWLANLHSGNGDMRMALISLATAVVSIVLVALLFTHFGLPVWMLVIALTMDTFWVASNIAGIYKMSQPNLKTPSLDDFDQFIETCTDNVKANEVFDRLDPEMQVQLQRAIKKHHRDHNIRSHDGPTTADFRRALQLVKNQRAWEEKNQLEALKLQLLPFIAAVV